MSDTSGVLAKWRINLREALSYTILVTAPSLMNQGVCHSWTDEQCTNLLAQLQEKYQLTTGVVPAGTYATAARYLADCFMNPKGDSPGMGKRSLGMDAVIDRMGRRLVLNKTSDIRHHRIGVLSDSGTHIYNIGEILRSPTRGKT